MSGEASVAAKRVLTALLEARTGQQLSPQRSWRIASSLKPLLTEFGQTTLDGLVAKLARGADGGALATRVVEALLNNETSFFRDKATFDQIEQEVVERLCSGPNARRLAIWSAACATGQEAYSLAMMLRAQPCEGRVIDIVATDVSAAAICQAKAGHYTPFEIQRGLPVRTMLRWFEQHGKVWHAVPELRRAVRFATHNLIDVAPGCFDLILCRNVLMYFPPSYRRAVFDRLADALLPGGLLVLGAGETVIGQTDRFTADAQLRGVYAHTPDYDSPRLAASR